MIERIKNWIYEKQDAACAKCPLLWEEWGAYHEDCDYGCLVGKDIDKFCGYIFLPLFIRKIMLKKWQRDYDKHWEQEAENLTNYFGDGRAKNEL